MSNPFQKFFTLPGFNEEDFVGENGLNRDCVTELGFAECDEETGGFTIFRRENELGGFDYLPFIDRWYSGTMPAIDPEKDRWLAGYDRGIVMFVAGESHNRQYVRHGPDREVTHHPPG